MAKYLLTWDIATKTNAALAACGLPVVQFGNGYDELAVMVSPVSSPSVLTNTGGNLTVEHTLSMTVICEFGTGKAALKGMPVFRETVEKALIHFRPALEKALDCLKWELGLIAPPTQAYGGAIGSDGGVEGNVVFEFTFSVYKKPEVEPKPIPEMD